MIRRATWLVVGAILGITGYRRLGKLARSISPQRLAVPGRRQAAGVLGRPGRAEIVGRPSPGLDAGAGAGAFLRDVRDGMAEYMARHSGRSGNTLVGQQARSGLRAIPGSDNPKDGR